MSQLVAVPTHSGGSSDLQQQIRARIESLSYLPTTVAVAMKFIELGKDPQADPRDYAKVISADSSLSSKILALANSSWFGVRNQVSTIHAAVNLLGLSTVRSLAISYCMTGLHNELGLTSDESHMFWEASLCKAVAAKQYTSMHAEHLANEGFLVGMFQDLALTIMYATGKEPLLAILQDPANDSSMQLEKEQYHFGMDHAEAGRILAQKLDLPDLLVDAIAFHHDHAQLNEFLDNESMGDAAYVASLFPHVMNAWNRRNADELCRFLREHAEDQEPETATCLTAIQDEFDQLYRFFEAGAEPETRLAELMQTAAREAADSATHLVTTVQQLMQQAAKTGVQVNELMHEQDKLEHMATRDSLTEVLNREGFTSEANELVGKAIRYGAGFAVVYLDIDGFKEVNDTFGHEVGDRVLKCVAEQMTDSLRGHDLVARIGGDEFAFLLYDSSEQEASRRVEQIVSRVAAQAVGRGKRSAKVSLSAGCLCAQPTGRPCSLDALLSAADKLMYQAKQAGGNQVKVRAIRV